MAYGFYNDRSKAPVYDISEANEYIRQQIAAAHHLKKQIVDTLPTPAQADADTLYYIMNQETGFYDIYQLIDGQMVRLDDTTIDLSDYATKNELPLELSQDSKRWLSRLNAKLPVEWGTGDFATVQGGQGAQATGASSHAEGQGTLASSISSHAEGSGARATGAQSHAEGQGTTASGMAAHAEGIGANASGVGSHAEGINTSANGQASHAAGIGTIAAEKQTVIGSYNEPNSDYAFIIGAGTSNNNRLNIHKVDWPGNAWYAGDVTGNKNGVVHILSNKIESADVDLLINGALATRAQAEAMIDRVIARRSA